jgi:hypothetical protein
MAVAAERCSNCASRISCAESNLQRTTNLCKIQPAAIVNVMLDRFVHSVRKIQIKGESTRKHQRVAPAVVGQRVLTLFH